MKHSILGRLFSIAAASALSCSAVSGSMVLHGAAAQSVQREASRQPLSDNTPVTVIVRVSGDAVLAQPEAAGMGADYLETDAAEAQTAACKAAQQAVEARIRQIYPALTVGYSYTALYNGFSCELPPDLIGAVRAVEGVVSVTEAGAVQVPQMDRAAALSGFPAYYDFTGCSGEGQVIAVIDSELDTSHPMFAPLADNIRTAVSREDIAEIAASGVLNVEIDPDRAYLSSKLPYVVDYLDADRYDGVPDSGSYHGTHISGVAAGNTFTADDGTVLSGIARDAQLMFFAIGKGRSINIGAAMAGFEDAVKLHADVITMSWGTSMEYFGENPFSEAAEAADRAGIVICNSAGNADNGTQSGRREGTPESPDTGMMEDKAELGSPILFVASADNSGKTETGSFLFEGQQIIYRPTADSDGNIYFLSQMLEPGEYSYTDCGYGTPEEMQAASPAQKLALVRRGSLQFAEIAANAREAGAAGVIVIDREKTDGMQYAVSDDLTRLMVISYAEGQMLLEAENKTVTLTGENVIRDYATQVSAFTSWGVKNSLDLRPDIMGIGGRVRSAAYGSTDQTLSGTSVAAPYVAGCAAVLREYLMQQNIGLEGAALTSYIRRLMMNTAIPYEENGLYVTPRRQGAGLVSLDRAVAAKVLMTGTDGDAKVNLFDELDESISFDVEITNFSDEDVTFAEAGLHLTTDGFSNDPASGGSVLSGEQALLCKTDFSGPYTIGAGESETVTVRAMLNAMQCSRLSEVFRYGFFVEGYLMLSGAENSADISIPLLGFYGDWTQLPVAAPDRIMAATVSRENYYADGVPLVEQKELIRKIRARVPETVPWHQRTDLRDYATEEEKHLLDCGRNEAWISPNDDGIADSMYGILLVPYRNARADLELRNASGALVYSEKNIRFTDIVELNCEQSALPDGDYTLTAKMYIDYPGSKENPQIFRSNLHVDRTAPEVTVGYEERRGRKILILTASDNKKLQGAAISGSGIGGAAALYDPEKGWQDNSEEYWYFGSSPYNGVYPWYAGTDSEKTEELPLVLREWAGYPKQQKDRDMNFRDYVSFTEAADGTFMLEYDVTDLKDYSFAVLDYAYNYTEIFTTDYAAEKLIEERGFWHDFTRGFYEIKEDCITFTSYLDGSVTDYSYSAKFNQLTLRNGGRTEKYTVQKNEDYEYILSDTSNDTVITISKYSDMSVFIGRPFHPVNELMKLAAADSAAQYGREPVRTEIAYICGPNSVGLRIYYEYEENGSRVEACDAYENFSLYTGSGIAIMKQQVIGGGAEGAVRTQPRIVNLFAESVTEIPPGLYCQQESSCAFLFNADGRTGRILYGGDAYDSLGISEDTAFAYSVDEQQCSIDLSYAGYTLRGNLKSGTYPGEIVIEPELTEDANRCPLTHYCMTLSFLPVNAAQEQLAQLPSDAEMIALCTAYETAANGAAPDAVSLLCFDRDCGCNIEFIYGDNSYLIFADPVTLTGLDPSCMPLDLRNPPQLPEGAYSIEAIRDMAVSDFVQRNGITPDSASARLNADGSVTVTMDEADTFEILDIYTVDPVSGEGFNSKDEEINLPQTGISDPGDRTVTVLAVLLLLSGGLCCGFARRRKEPET